MLPHAWFLPSGSPPEPQMTERVVAPGLQTSKQGEKTHRTIMLVCSALTIHRGMTGPVTLYCAFVVVVVFYCCFVWLVFETGSFVAVASPGTCFVEFVL